MSDLPATHPTTLLPDLLESGEQYARVEDILECSDLPEATLHIPHWRIRGTPAAIRVRALSLAQREAIQQEATRRDGSIDVVAQLLATWREGCVQPTFTLEQAGALKRKNPIAIEAGANFIWLLSSLNQEWIDGVVARRTNAPPPAAPAPDAEGGDAAAATDPDDRRRVRRVA